MSKTSNAKPPVDPAIDPGPTVVPFPGPGVLSRLLSLAMMLAVRPVISAFGRWPELRWPFGLVNLAALVLPRPRRVARRRVRLPNCQAELIVPNAAPESATPILYLHGGGFLTCGINTHRLLAADVAHAAGMTTLLVDYRQLPKHGLTEALDDCIDGFRELLSRGHAAHDICIVGDSAGGYLAVATALAVQRAGLGQPRALALLSPVSTVGTDIGAESVATDPLLTRRTLQTISRMLEERRSRSRPASRLPLPRLVDDKLGDLPPTLIQVGTREILYPGARELAGGISSAGVRCELQIWKGQFHVFQAAAIVMPTARKAVAELGAFLRQAAAG